MTDVLFPALSREDAAARGVLATWFVRDGESVEADQLLAEVPAPAAGTVRLLVKEEAEVEQGTPIARIG